MVQIHLKQELYYRRHTFKSRVSTTNVLKRTVLYVCFEMERKRHSINREPSNIIVLNLPQQTATDRNDCKICLEPYLGSFLRERSSLLYDVRGLCLYTNISILLLHTFVHFVELSMTVMPLEVIQTSAFYNIITMAVQTCEVRVI